MSGGKRKNGKYPITKFLQVKEYGDSLYVPLTKFFRPLNIRKDSIVKVILNGPNGDIIIRNPNKK